ncbi:MAG: type I restriction-modification system subunit M N-terminal domain-containing protein [Leptospiraceae bacterium]|nr:type I restriction-modification system subunit M N-terminal domain-containing protein [Leptospiraceae bacterium]NUM41202.1 type I restriction-modification system subunit M N-terminal domain-containing protein [Leptospiraceae bacterium]
MTENNQYRLGMPGHNNLGNTLWKIADELRGAMNADQFRDYMLSFLFLRYLSDNYETAAIKELGKDYPVLKDNDKRTPLSVWYEQNKDDVTEFEKQMRRKVHYVIEPSHLWNSIAELAKTQSKELLRTLQDGFKYIVNESFESTFQPENIDKIVSTYKNRTEETRYARRVSMDEIEKNEFNLNISRYVSTSLDEELIDLKEVNKKLVDLDKDINKVRETHNKFLKELGLPPI